MITVITHNGKSLREGGRFIAVQADNKVFDLMNYPHGVILAPPAPTPRFAYFGLPTTNRYGDCACGIQDNPATTIETPDAGAQQVYKCRGCGALMRPRTNDRMHMAYA